MIEKRDNRRVSRVRYEIALRKILNLEEEVLRLRQQRDAANAQLDWLLEQPEVDKEMSAK
ncbi:TPA_asm: hypothetical protein GI614_22715 [Salmonella enterica subsp. enterica serovar Enteritidis]|uniref:Uncharacterized protein n=1 Tax=Salmonella enteritidis TaxID=149539 RepID=A0A6X7CDE4_SALEN|nr:hypothetical protein [Salmonella enterica subsp. enterica serovar Enteritidis]